MYIIDIVIDQTQIPTGQADDLLNKHRQWFAKYFQAGKFLLLGPYLDQSAAGVIIAKTDSRAELDAILEEDVYFLPKQADYRVREFKAALAVSGLNE